MEPPLQRSCRSLRELPQDVLFLLCSHLDAHALVRLSATSSWLYQALCSPAIWQPRCLAHGVAGVDGWPSGITHRTLYLHLLRPYGDKLGVWTGECPPFGSLLLVTLEPPRLVGYYCTCLSLNAGLQLLPAFEVRLQRLSNTLNALQQRQWQQRQQQQQHPPSTKDQGLQQQQWKAGGFAQTQHPGGSCGAGPSGAALTAAAAGNNSRSSGQVTAGGESVCRTPSGARPWLTALPRFRTVARCLRCAHEQGTGAAGGLGGGPELLPAWLQLPPFAHLPHMNLSGPGSRRRQAAGGRQHGCRFFAPPQQLMRSASASDGSQADDGVDGGGCGHGSNSGTGEGGGSRPAFVLCCQRGCRQDVLELFARHGLSGQLREAGALHLPLAPLLHTAAQLARGATAAVATGPSTSAAPCTTPTRVAAGAARAAAVTATAAALLPRLQHLLPDVAPAGELRMAGLSQSLLYLMSYRRKAAQQRRRLRRQGLVGEGRGEGEDGDLVVGGEEADVIVEDEQLGDGAEVGEELGELQQLVEQAEEVQDEEGEEEDEEVVDEEEEFHAALGWEEQQHHNQQQEEDLEVQGGANWSASYSSSSSGVVSDQDDRPVSSDADQGAENLHPEPLDPVAAQEAAWAALERGTLFRPLDLPHLPSSHMLCGLWVGTYGLHGMELVKLQQRPMLGCSTSSTGTCIAGSSGAGSAAAGSERLLVASKLTGDYHVPAGECTFEVQLGESFPLSWQQRLSQQDYGDPDTSLWAGGLQEQLQQLQQPGATPQQLCAHWPPIAARLCQLMGRPGDLLSLPQGYSSRVNLNGHRLRIKSCWPALAQVAQPGHVHPFWFLASCALLEWEEGDWDLGPNSSFQAEGQLGGATGRDGEAGAAGAQVAGAGGGGHNTRDRARSEGTTANQPGDDNSIGDGSGEGGAGAAAPDSRKEAEEGQRLCVQQLLQHAVGEGGGYGGRPCLMALAWTQVRTLSLFVRMRLPGVEE